jgi:hypothetical protein
VRSAVLLFLVGLVVAVIVFVATSGHVLFLPLILFPLVLSWPLGRRRRS